MNKMKNKSTNELLQKLKEIQSQCECYFKAISQERLEITIQQKKTFQRFIDELINEQKEVFKELKSRWFYR